MILTLQEHRSFIYVAILALLSWLLVNMFELQETKKRLIDYSRKSDLFNMGKFTREFSENLINICGL